METNRIILRPWRDSDAETLYKWASDPDVGPRAGWAPHQSVEIGNRQTMNILIINGSPRKKGLISQMLGIMREEAEKRGDTAVQLISKAPTHF